MIQIVDLFDLHVYSSFIGTMLLSSMPLEDPQVKPSRIYSCMSWVSRVEVTLNGKEINFDLGAS